MYNKCKDLNWTFGIIFHNYMASFTELKSFEIKKKKKKICAHMNLKCSLYGV